MWQQILIKVVMFLLPFIEQESHVLIANLINELSQKTQVADPTTVVTTAQVAVVTTKGVKSK